MIFEWVVNTQWNDTISRADLWALLGIWAVQQTIEKGNKECEDYDTVPDLAVEFQWGRQVGGKSL